MNGRYVNRTSFSRTPGSRRSAGNVIALPTGRRARDVASPKGSRWLVLLTFISSLATIAGLCSLIDGT